jgi:hypothetical protein
MPQPIGKQRNKAIFADIFEAELDLTGLITKHKLTPQMLADWIGKEPHQRCLAELCVLADLQTQLMLSRYRQLAVSELIKQATGGGEGGSVSSEQARKACVDLLKADLKRVPLIHPSSLPQPDDGEDADDGGQEIQAMRDALYAGEAG